jgi:hypothetical protein
MPVASPSRATTGDAHSPCHQWCLEGQPSPCADGPNVLWCTGIDGHLDVPGEDGDHRGRGGPPADPSDPWARRQEERTRCGLGHPTGVHPEPRAAQPGRNQLDVQSRRYEMDQAAGQQQAGQTEPGPSGPWIFEAFYGVFDGLLNGHG